MIYNKTNWQPGDIIAEQKLNNIENGLEHFFGKINTIELASFSFTPQAPSAEGVNYYEYSFESENVINQTCITVIFDNVEYTCYAYVPSGLDIGHCYGARRSSGSSNYDFTQYPFAIYSPNDPSIITSDASEHTITILAKETVIEPVTTIYLIKSQYKVNGDYYKINTSFNNILNAIEKNMIPAVVSMAMPNSTDINYSFLNKISLNSSLFPGAQEVVFGDISYYSSSPEDIMVDANGFNLNPGGEFN